MTTDLSTQLHIHRFPDPAALAHALALAVAADLRGALAARGQASIALSGGNTPKAFLQSLSAQLLDWAKVSVTLVDERWVADTDPRSNARLLRENLLQGPAALARFLPLYRNTPLPQAALAEVQRDLASAPQPFDVIVLGMGNDGHTASFFPGGDHLAQALDPSCSALLLPMRAPGAGEPRVTLTLPALLSAAHLYLHIEGPQKWQVLQQAITGEGIGAGYPIRSVLLSAPAPVLAYWAA